MKKPRPARSSRGLRIKNNVISAGDGKSSDKHSRGRYNNNTTTPGCSISEALLTPEELLFYAYFAIMLLVKGLGFSDGPVYKAGFLAGSVLALVKILLSSYTWAEALTVYLLLALAGISFLHSRDYSVIVYSLLILSLKGIRQERAMKLGALVWTPTFLFQILTQLAGLRTRDFVVHSKYRLGYIVRWALGYVHPNVLQITYVVFLSYLLYSLRGENLTGKRFLRLMLFCTLGGLYIFLYSLSLTGMIGYVVFLLMMLFFESKRRRGRALTAAEAFLLQCLLPLEIAVAVAAPIVLHGKAFDVLNRAMTTRPMLTRIFFTQYGLRLFGNQKPAGESWTITLDSSYAELQFYGGIVIFVLMMAGYFVLIHRALRETPSWRHSVKMAVIFFCMAAAVSEPFAFNTSYKNVSLIFLGCELLREKPEETVCLLGWIPAGIRQHRFALPNPFSKVRIILQFFRKGRQMHWRSAVTAAALGMTAAAILYGNIAVRADAYYCRKRSADVPDGEMKELYLSAQEVSELQAEPGVRVLNYLDDRDPMYCFTGRITEYDYVRGAVSAVLWSGLGAGLVTAGICGTRNGRSPGKSARLKLEGKDGNRREYHYNSDANL